MELEDKRGNVLSVPVNREELKAFNKCRRMAEEENDNRISNAKFIRDYILLPYLKNNPYPDNEDIWQSQTELENKQESKPDSEQKSEMGKYAAMLNDL